MHGGWRWPNQGCHTGEHKAHQTSDLLPVVRPWISHNLSGPQFFLIYKMIKSLKSLKVNIRQNPDTELPSAVGQPALCLFHVQ